MTEQPVPAAADDLYAPNQQVVRADGSGPAEEGSGGSQPSDAGPVERSLEQADEATSEPHQSHQRQTHHQ
jgi:hypothetical protein